MSASELAEATKANIRAPVASDKPINTRWKRDDKPKSTKPTFTPANKPKLSAFGHGKPNNRRQPRERGGVPPAGYECKICGEVTHFVADCPQKKPSRGGQGHSKYQSREQGGGGGSSSRGGVQYGVGQAPMFS